MIADPELHKYTSHEPTCRTFLQPNYTRNEEESRRHYEYDYLTLTADRGHNPSGQTIIDKGAIITGQDYTNLHTYETMMAQLSYKENQSKIPDASRAVPLRGSAHEPALLYFRFFSPAVYGNIRANTVLCYILLTLFFLISHGP